MAKYRVNMTRYIQQSVTVEVEADSESAASNKALYDSDDPENNQWEQRGEPTGEAVESCELIEEDEETREDDLWHDQWESHEFGSK
jgi:hypothetical protein